MAKRTGRSTTAAPPLTEYIVYVLSQKGRSLFLRPSQGSRTYYTGATSDLPRRIADHNAGRTTSTRGIEWELVAHLPGFTKTQAFQVEHYLKRGDTRKKRALFYAFCELARSDDTAAQQYYTHIYPALRRYLRHGEEDING